MPIRLEEYEAMKEKYDRLLRDTKIGLYKEMKGSAWSEEELFTYVAKAMEPFLEKYIPDGHKECGYMEKGCDAYSGFMQMIQPRVTRVIQRDLSDIIEKIESPPVEEEYFYKLADDALKIIFGETPIELYDSDTEYFMKYFDVLDEKEREEVVAALYSHDKRNEEADKLLSSKYPNLVNKIGMNSVEQ